MSVMIEQDLKDYLDQKFSNFERRFEEKFDKIDQQFDKIDQRFDKIDQRLERIENDITDLKVGQARLEEKIDGLDKRLGFQEFINRGVLIGFIMAILGGLAKVFGFIPNP
jgi:chromosome segregation ATPase